MTLRTFAVEYAQPERLAAFYDVATVCADSPTGGDGLMRGEIVTADGIQIVRATNIPRSVFLNNPTGKALTGRYILAMASHAQTVLTPSRGAYWLNPRELFVLNTALPWQVQVSRTHMSTVMTVEEDVIRQLSSGDSAILDGHDCQSFRFNSILNAVMDSAWELAQKGCFEQAAPRLLRSLIDALVLASLAEEFGECDRSADILKIRFDEAGDYVKRHYADPSLTAEAIANGIGVSSRYLRHVFAKQSCSPSRYLYDFRLDTAAKQLRDRQFSRMAVTELAMRNGFNSSAHFSTEFKRRFGMSPRDYRRLHHD